MRKGLFRAVAAAATLAVGAVIGSGCSKSESQSEGNPESAEVPSGGKVQRYGFVIGLKPEKKDEYVKLHAETWPEVLDMISKCNIRNYSIYMTELEGKLYLFAYFEYTGEDFEADMEKMKADPKTNEWWEVTDPCQIRLPDTPDGEQWLQIEEVFHTD
jgi:L-rhamnose mutarotase